MEQTNEKKYLNVAQKLGYGAGDFGSNAFYGMVTSFILIYLTNCLGLNAGYHFAGSKIYVFRTSYRKFECDDCRSCSLYKEKRRCIG